jgi:hypothetical protein
MRMKDSGDLDWSVFIRNSSFSICSDGKANRLADSLDGRYTRGDQPLPIKSALTLGSVRTELNHRTPS